MSTTQTVHFTVCAEWLTNFIRSQWAEGSFEKALRTLEAAFPEMSLEQRYDIIRGKRKLIKDPQDENSMLLVKDSWKPDLDRCAHGQYLDPEDRAALAHRAQLLEDEHFQNEISQALNLMLSIDETTDGQQLKTLHERLSGLSDEAVEEAGKLKSREKNPPKVENNRRLMVKFGGFDSVEQMNMALMLQRNTPTPEQMLQNERSRDERERQGKPKPDRKLQGKLGWILPNGSFYSCLTPMEHVWLARQLGCSETEAQAMGWVKITKDIFTDQTVILQLGRKPTQRQIDTTFDWCQKHAPSKLPEWAGAVEV